MLIDEVEIIARAGDGGAGLVAFSKQMKMHAPTGGDGGAGGDLYVEGVSDLNVLNQYRNQKEFSAEKGKPGGQNRRHGADGEDVVLKVPVGTIVYKLETILDAPEEFTRKQAEGRFPFEVTEVDQRILVARGGKGGKGNAEFRSSRKTSPEYAQKGLAGEAFKVRLELRLIADIGLIGLPNVGKSSLLNELTPKAAAKVANYEFTTLEPNLGAYWVTGADWERDKPVILADIPGVIEGAAEGKGLGHKFLRHIERTKVLFHCVAADSADPVADYKAIRAELTKYNPELMKKEEYLFVTRTDTVSPESVAKTVKAMMKLNKRITAISIYDDESLDSVRSLLDEITE